jgi:hypothetical protein
MSHDGKEEFGKAVRELDSPKYFEQYQAWSMESLAR